MQLLDKLKLFFSISSNLDCLEDAKQATNWFQFQNYAASFM